MKFVTRGGEITVLRSTAGAPSLDLDRPSVPIRFPTERRCPQEIFDCIIDELADDPYTLRSLSLTCQDFLLKSRSYLFSTVCLGSDGKNYSGLVHTISRTPILASYIRTLYVEPGLADIGSVFVRTPSLLPHLRELWLISLPPTLHHSTPFFCTQLLSVANLHLKGCQFFSFDHFWRLVISFRNLCKLYFQSITWERPSLFKDFARIPSRDRPLRLTELYGRGNDVEINTVLSWYIAISKFTETLVSLTLDLTGGGGGHLDTTSTCMTLNVLFDKYSTSLQTVQLTFAESDLEVEGPCSILNFGALHNLKIVKLGLIFPRHIPTLLPIFSSIKSRFLTEVHLEFNLEYSVRRFRRTSWTSLDNILASDPLINRLEKVMVTYYHGVRGMNDQFRRVLPALDRYGILLFSLDL